jgi:hypothetical protein
MTQPHVKFLLRLPPDLHASLKDAAATNSPPNSLHHEILARLYRTFKEHERLERLLREKVSELDTLRALVVQARERVDGTA